MTTSLKLTLFYLLLMTTIFSTSLKNTLSSSLRSAPFRTAGCRSLHSSKEFHVAPMMKHTTRHFRYFFRLISKKAILYTEMIMADAIINAAELDAQQKMPTENMHLESLLGVSSEESPVVLQLGGRCPEKLSHAVKLAVSFFSERGIPNPYSAVNLNCGCPSGIVATESAMGAAMMLEPELTAECCRRMRESSSMLPVSVKCRLGVDDIDSYEALARFIDTVWRRGGVAEFQVHARKALLTVGTRNNRLLAPLNYETVHRLARDFPEVKFSINGGFDTIESVVRELEGPEKGVDESQLPPRIKGVMVGRACINHPYLWSRVDSEVGDCLGDSDGATVRPRPLTRKDILEGYLSYCEAFERRELEKYRIEVGAGGRNVPSSKLTAALVAPVFNLFAGEDGCEKYRRTLKKCIDRGIKSSCLAVHTALVHIPEHVLHSTDAVPISGLPEYDMAKKSTTPLRRQIY